MKILSAAQTRELDQATMQEQGITSVELMERAVSKLYGWWWMAYSPGSDVPVVVLCGPGNNGGDGLALARQLSMHGGSVRVVLLPAKQYSPEWQHYLELLPPSVPVVEFNPNKPPTLTKETLIVDALFGTGLNRPLSGTAAAMAHWVNAIRAVVLAIDLPSGLFADQPQPADSPIVRATYTMTFGLPKLALLLPQNGPYVGEWMVEDIGLSSRFIKQAATPWHFAQLAAGGPPSHPLPELPMPQRNKFAYKNTFGHALLLAGSRGKMGAAVLAAGACLRGGVGLLTVAVPGCGYDILQTTRPEAMCLPDKQPAHLSELPDLTPYQAVAIGPGLGQDAASLAVLEQLLRTAKVPLVIDADALNMLGSHRALLKLLPPDTVLTPHVGEFTRLTEKARDDYHRLELLQAFAREHQCIVVLKGAYTAVADRDGQLYFNGSGNPGMATGGSGDVLTGLLLAFRADQRLAPLPAVRLAVLTHGYAGDLAAQEVGEAGLVAGDLVQYLGPALRDLTA